MTNKEILEITDKMLKRHSTGEGEKIRETDFIEYLLNVKTAISSIPTWIPVKVRPTTEEDDIDMVAYPWFLDFPLPDEGQEILVLCGGTVDKDTNMTDDGVSYYLDGYGDWAEVDAWMPLPEPYKEGE